MTTSEKLTALLARHLMSVKVLDELVSLVKASALDKMRSSFAASVAALDNSLRSIVDRYPSEAEGRELFDSALTWARQYMSSLLHAYPEFFYNMAFIYRCALHDAFASDVITLVLIHRPEILKSSRTLTYEQIVDSVVAGTIIEKMAEREVLELSYKSIADQLKWVREKLGIALLRDEEKQRAMVELYARRNLLVHAQGVVNGRYISETGSSTTPGSVLAVAEDYLTKSGELLTAFVAELIVGIGEQFGIVIPGRIAPWPLLTSQTPNPAEPPPDFPSAIAAGRLDAPLSAAAPPTR